MWVDYLDHLPLVGRDTARCPMCSTAPVPKKLQLPCISTAFAAETPPVALMCSTAPVPKKLQLPCISTALAAENTAVALCPHCLRG